MLPLVGIVAVGLLLVAGKLFFLSGMQPDKPALPVISTSPAVVRQEKSAQAETPSSSGGNRTTPTSVLPTTTSAVVPTSADAPEGRRLPPATLDVLAVPYDSKTNPPTNSSKGKNDSVVVTSVPVAPQKTSQRPPVKEQLTRPRTQAKTATTPPATPDKKTTSAPPPTPPKPTWMVQVGAYSTQGAADTVVQQLKKAGYSGTIVSGKTLFRVLVQAGATRDDALATATKLSQSGFQGAFIVPPRS